MIKKAPMDTLQEVLRKIKEYDDFYIKSNRDKNRNFLLKYVIKKEYIKYVIKNLNINNYRRTIENKDEKIKTSYLYVFEKILSIQNDDGIEDSVKVFIKIGFLNGKTICVVSFHDSEF